MYHLAQMSKITAAEHENLFALDTAMDEGAEDGAGAAMVADLGDKVVPFPREFHVKLFQEMIHVWSVESALMLHPGSGQGLLAFVLERKRAVGIMKNKSHLKFVKQNLAQAVKSLGLAPDRRPAKPAELCAWEASRGAASVALPPATPPFTPMVTPKAAAPSVRPTIGQVTSSPAVTPALPAAQVTVAPVAPVPPVAPVAADATLVAFGSAALR